MDTLDQTGLEKQSVAVVLSLPPVAFLAWLSGSPVGEWVSGSTWAYPGLLFIHTLGLGILVGLNSAVGLRLLGFAPNVPVADLEPLFQYMWAGFWVNAVSGSILFWAGWSGA